MIYTTAQRVLLAVNVLIVLGFGWFYAASLNYEFLAYVGTIAVVAVVLFGTLRWTRFSTIILAGVTLWGLLHMLGGSLITPDGVLYAYRIYPFFDGGGDFYILKMDQVIHAYLYGVVGVMFYHLLREIVGIKTHGWFIGFVAIFAAAGFSILNEIVEFLAAVNLPETGVGGYENTVLDMIFNLAGSTIGVALYSLLKK